MHLTYNIIVRPKYNYHIKNSTTQHVKNNIN